MCRMKGVFGGSESWWCRFQELLTKLSRSFVKLSGEHAIKLKFRQNFKNASTVSIKKVMSAMYIFAKKTVLNETNFFDVDENPWFQNFYLPETNIISLRNCC